MDERDTRYSAIQAYESAARSMENADDILDSNDSATIESSDVYNQRHEEAQSRREEAVAERLEGENRLRERIGTSALKFVWRQLLVSDVIVGAYVLAMLFMRREVPEGIIVGWMTATVVETIGILWVIARSLFPFRDERRDRDAEGDRRRG